MKVSCIDLVKKTICLLALNLIIFSVAALPGVTDYLPTESGQYVYYKDKTFEQDTYIGFLQYDDATYALRFFSPNATLTSSNIEILITLDTSLSYVNLTGEKIISEITPNDVDIVNYLHDLFYDLTRIRSNLDEENWSKEVSTNQDYQQFGGLVTLSFNSLIPLFNLNTIYNDKGEIIFYAVTMGELSDSNDTSFSDFKGFKEPIPSLTNKKVKNLTKKQTTELDEKWVEQTENFWILNDDAIIFISETEIDQTTPNTYSISNYMNRIYLLSSQNSYTYLPLALQNISKKNNNKEIVAKCENLILQDINTNKYVHDFKILRKTKDNTYKMYVLSVYQDFYLANEKYFTDIVKKLEK